MAMGVAVRMWNPSHGGVIRGRFSALPKKSHVASGEAGTTKESVSS
jgi:hypothetical protein